MSHAASGTRPQSGESPEKIEEQQQIAAIARNAQTFFEKYERYDCQELLAYSITHWMLSSDDFKIPTDPPVGLITSVNPLNSNSCFLLIPAADSSEEEDQPLDYRELHQIVRELTMGIYVLNQTPHIQLEANFDQSTQCQLPPAYQDTRIGQIMVSVDYMMKALWHGCYFPMEKRKKFSEKWRSNFDVNSHGKPDTKKHLLTEFTGAGMLDITSDPDYANVYSKLPVEAPGDMEMAEERRFFSSHVEDIKMQLTFFQNEVKHYKDMFVMDSDWIVSSVIKLLDEDMDSTSYERLNSRLQLHEQVIKGNLGNKMEIKRHLHLLKFISYMTPFLIGMRKRMKIPDISRLLPNMTGDECRTERELPPLMLSPDFKCKNFSPSNHYFQLHGGILIDLETKRLEELPSESALAGVYEEVTEEARIHLSKMLENESPVLEHYKIPTCNIDGNRYYVMMLDFETFYPQSPQKPLWVKVFHEEIVKLRPKRLPLDDNQLSEQFKKYFGYKKAMKYKLPQTGLVVSAQRGLVAMFQTQCRRMTASRLGKQDEHGLSLLHYAAMNNHPQIIAMLLLQSMDVNVRRNNILSTGPTALHVAARCGALDAVACLLANFANCLATDQSGWAPIHHSAYFDHSPVIKLMIRKNPSLMELSTKDDLRSSPLLLSASSGGLSAVKCLIELGADISKKDMENNGLVSRAAIRFHTNVLEYLIEWNHKDVPVWKILVTMLNAEDIKKKDSAVKCLEVLSTSKPDHWRSILEADGVPALVNILRIDNEELQSVAASVLCNISEQEEVRLALTNAEAGPILIKLLGSSVDDIQSRAAIILSDLACVEGNQDLIAENSGIAPLVNLLDSELEDVLVNAVNAIRVLCLNNPNNQTAAAKCGAVEPLVEFLTVNSDILQAATSAAIAAVASGHQENQDLFLQENAVRPLVDLIKGRNVKVQVKAANALESLATNNHRCQMAFLELDAPRALIRLLKNINPEVQSQGACALWSLAGDTKIQQKHIAEVTGIPHIIQMLLAQKEKLLQVGCMMAIALGNESIENQNKLAAANAFQQLVRLLRSQKTSPQVMLMVIKVLGILCVGVAYQNNRVTQRKIAEEHAIPLLVDMLNKPLTEEIQVEVAISLGCIILSNTDNQDTLKEEPHFKFDVLLELLRSKNMEIRLRAGMALTIFAFNNTPQQYAIREAGGIKYSVFEPFINSSDEFYVCYAAFQIVVLARVIVDKDQVTLTAEGVTLLVHKLDSADDNVIVLAASLLSSLAHTRAGIPDAMVTTGAIDMLVNKLSSPNEQVRTAVAVSLGYLTFNKTAARLLFGICRNTPGLFKKLTDNIGKDCKISSEFLEDFRRAKIIGLPSQCLEINGGPPVVPPSRKGGQRPRTTGYQRSQIHSLLRDRAVSAPLRKRTSPVPSIVVSKSDEVSRPSTGLTRPSTGFTRSMSAMSAHIPPAPTDTNFKSRLTSWKEEK